jgi:DNA-binding IclR family transcriptional regulator
MEQLTYQQARDRIRAEYHEMPGMRLTARQVARLCGLDPATCQVALEDLTRGGILIRRPGDVYSLGRDDMEVLVPRRRRA